MSAANARLAPTQVPAPRTCVRLDQAFLDQFVARDGGWQDKTLPLPGGGLRVRNGGIGSGLFVTRSVATLSTDYRARLEHEGTMSSLCFGCVGTNLFGMGGREPSHVIRPGDAWLIHSANATTSRWTPAQKGATMVSINLSSERLAEVLDHIGITRDGSRAVRLGHADLSQINLDGLLNNPLASPLDRLLAESQALALLAHWLAPLPSAPACDAMCGRPGSHERCRLARVVDRLVSDLCHPPSLDQLAQEAGMSHVRLNRCFRRVYGKTVFAWLREYRLDRACRYLRDDSHSVTDIAFLCGFSSSSHFAAAFRERHGCAPAEYRRQGR